MFRRLRNLSERCPTSESAAPRRLETNGTLSRGSSKRALGLICKKTNTLGLSVCGNGANLRTPKKKKEKKKILKTRVLRLFGNVLLRVARLRLLAKKKRMIKIKE